MYLLFLLASSYKLDLWGCEYNCPAGTTNKDPEMAPRRDTNPHRWCTKPCPIGFWCPGTIGGGTIKCPAGVFGNKFSLSTNLCSGKCPANHYCPEGTVKPLACPDGMSTTSDNSKSLEDCITCAGKYV